MRQLVTWPTVFPPFDLNAQPETLVALSSGLTGYAGDMAEYAPDEAGPRVNMVWLAGPEGRWAISVGQRDLQFKFEVFNLCVETEAALTARIEAASPPRLPEDAPAWIRAIATAGLVVPRPPTEFRPWPFEQWRVEIARADLDVQPESWLPLNLMQSLQTIMELVKLKGWERWRRRHRPGIAAPTHARAVQEIDLEHQ